MDTRGLDATVDAFPSPWTVGLDAGVTLDLFIIPFAMCRFARVPCFLPSFLRRQIAHILSYFATYSLLRIPRKYFAFGSRIFQQPDGRGAGCSKGSPNRSIQVILMGSNSNP